MTGINIALELKEALIMSEKKISEILDIISAKKERDVADVTIEQGEDGPVLTLGMASPYDAEKAVGFTLSIEESEGVYLTDIMYIAFTQVEPELFDQLNQLICDINLGMIIGNFVLVKDMNAVVFNLGFYAHDRMSAHSIAMQAVHNIDLIQKQISGAEMWLYRFIKGECDFDEVLTAVNDTGEGE